MKTTFAHMVAFALVLLFVTRPHAAELEPVKNLLGADMASCATAKGMVVKAVPDGLGVTATMAPDTAEGAVVFGPIGLPGNTAILRFTAGLGLGGTDESLLSAVFTAGATDGEPSEIPFSAFAAKQGSVMQDLYVPVPAGSTHVRLELAVKPSGSATPIVTVRYPCLQALPATEPRAPAQGLVFTQGFSHPDGRADAVNGNSRFPAWTCVLPTAKGKSGPGLKAEQPEDAVAYVLAEQQLMARGRASFWLRPLWDQGDARPGTMLVITPGGGTIVVRKNHGWSFLFVAWDAARKTQSTHCDLRNLRRDSWTKVEAVWDSTKGLRLIVNGVVLGKKDCTWTPAPPERLGIRLGQSDHDKPDRAPYVLDDVEVGTAIPEGMF